MKQVIAIREVRKTHVSVVGVRGRRGVTITGAYANPETGTLVFVYEDGTEIDTGSIIGGNSIWGGIVGDINNQTDLISLVNAAIAAHVTALDPHPEYTTAAEAAAAAPVQSVNGQTGDVAITKADVGLGSADNTSDADKPISTAQQAALNGKVDKVAGMGLSSNDFTDPLRDKLIGLEGTHWRGTFVSLAALQAGVTAPAAGDYADVDTVGADVVRYIWDATDGTWAAQSGEAAPITASQTKLLYESNPDTNAFTDADEAKLDGIESGATANSTDAHLLNRANHTGTQAGTTVTVADAGDYFTGDNVEAVLQEVGAALAATGAGGWDNKATPAISAGVLTLDLSDPVGFVVTLDQNITSIVFSNAPSDKVVTFTITFVQDATGGRTVAFPAAVQGTPTAPVTAANEVTIQSFITWDGATTVYQAQ